MPLDGALPAPPLGSSCRIPRRTSSFGAFRPGSQPARKPLIADIVLLPLVTRPRLSAARLLERSGLSVATGRLFAAVCACLVMASW
jgi:hypothetical protein